MPIPNYRQAARSRAETRKARKRRESGPQYRYVTPAATAAAMPASPAKGQEDVP
jgi:hypothetical protein